MRIRTVKGLKATNNIYSLYKLSQKFTVHHLSTNTEDAWDTTEVFVYDGKHLIAVTDQSRILPSILFKAKIELLTPHEWTK